MPKDVVQNLPGDRFQVRIGWQPDMDVQVGIESTEGFSLVDRLYGEDASLERIGAAAREAGLASPEPLDSAHEQELNRIAGRQVLNLVTGNPNDPLVSYTGVWVDLTRSGINRMIKSLRRARDSAYGRDE